MIASIFRAVKAAYGQSAEANIRLTNYSSLATAKYEPDFTEVLRSGRRFVGGVQVIADGVTGLTTIPTTTASVALFNGENQGGKSYIVDGISIGIGLTAPTTGYILFAGLSRTIIATPAAAANYSSQSASSSSLSTKAIWATALATFTPQPSWINVGAGNIVVTGGIGGDNTFQHTRFLIPPQFALGFAILATAAGEWLIHASWSELDIELE